MQLQVHVMAGWCVSNTMTLNPRERLFAMAVSVIPDLDGLGILWSMEAYAKYHHVLGHNVLFGALISGLLAAFSERFWRVLGLYLGLFHLHLLMDLLGSGIGWGVPYFWPWSNQMHEFSFAWELISWQNFVFALGCLFWLIHLVRYHHRSPFELLWPKLNTQLVQRYGKKVPSLESVKR